MLRIDGGQLVESRLGCVIVRWVVNPGIAIKRDIHNKSTPGTECAPLQCIRLFLNDPRRSQTTAKTFMHQSVVKRRRLLPRDPTQRVHPPDLAAGDFSALSADALWGRPIRQASARNSSPAALSFHATRQPVEKFEPQFGF